MVKLLILSGFVMLFAGCSTSMRDSAKISSSPISAAKRGEQIVTAVIDTDYRKFIRAAEELTDIPEREQQEFQDSCRNLTERYGKPESFRYLGELQTPLLSNQLYAVRFVRKTNDGKEIIQEQLFQIIFGKEQGHLKLLGMRFI